MNGRKARGPSAALINGAGSGRRWWASRRLLAPSNSVARFGQLEQITGYLLPVRLVATCLNAGRVPWPGEGAHPAYWAFRPTHSCLQNWL